MKNTLAFIVFMLSISLSTAQTSKIKWSERGLTWADFQGIPPQNVPYSSEIYYYFSLFPETFKVNDTTVRAYRTACYVDTRQSWSKVEAQTTASLLYHQTVFDIAESYARKLDNTINKFTENELGQQFTFKQNECNKVIHSFAEASNYGQNESVVNEWHDRLKKELDMPLRAKIPSFTKSNFRYGMYASAGVSTFTNTLNQHFTNAFGIHYGFEFAHKKIMFGVNAALLVNQIKKDFETDYIWTKGFKTNMAIGDIYAGYVIFDNPKQRLYPHFGIGVVEITARSKDTIYEKYRDYNYNVTLGITHDYKLKKTVNFRTGNFVASTREYIETVIKTRLSFSPAAFTSKVKGTAVNLSIGIGITGHKIKAVL